MSSIRFDDSSMRRSGGSPLTGRSSGHTLVGGGAGGGSSSVPSTTASRNKQDRRSVVTTPAWVRDADDDDNDYSFDGGAQASTSSSGGQQEQRRRRRLSSSSKARPRGPISMPSSSVGGMGGKTNGRGNGSGTTRSAPAGADAASPDVDDGAGGGEGGGGADRFWTFTLPKKYRNRLHEHHLRMMHHNKEQQQQQQQRPGTGQKRRQSARRRDSACTSGSSSSASSSSDDSSTCDSEPDNAGTAQQDDNLQGLSGAVPGGIDGRGKQRKRHHHHRPHLHSRKDNTSGPRTGSAIGLGEATSAGTAAGFLDGQRGMSETRRRQLQHHHHHHHRHNEQGQQREASAATGGETSGDESSGANAPQKTIGAPAAAPATSSDIEGQAGAAASSSSDPRTYLPATEMRARIPGKGGELGNSFTRFQAQTPGWESPWRPEAGQWDDYLAEQGQEQQQEEEGKERRSRRRKGPMAAMMMMRRKGGSSSKGDSSSRRGRNKAAAGAIVAFDEKTGQPIHSNNGHGRGSGTSSPLETVWASFLLHHPFAPLLLRCVNLCFTTSTLAIAIKLYQVLHAQNARDSVGSSPLFGIIVAPLSLVHVGAQVWLEYFGRPIGLWSVGSKLGYQLIELVFICLWSSLLSLTFDNYATSSLVCVNWYSPFNTSSSSSSGTCQGNQEGPDVLLDPRLQPYICRLQGAFIGLSFTTLLAYVLVFAVSLFRTVSRR